ncbi:putative inorganic phosphate cotransporter isoform X1 [Tribolium madens]|uniref:putative inorganic phosphate cotransporter isoform X1 n=1 Tax=Tribolium madens TaxID=41895 RepID=UPI001CF734C9|nr:putative inorganic phosphate cotransporter isoform X1 [Tribolium madens]
MSTDQKLAQNEEFKAPAGWYGSRHTQVLLCFLLLAIAYAMRVNLSVAIVAMTDNSTTSNPDIPTYDWEDKSVVLSSFFWGYVVLQVFAGQFGKTYGPRWFLVVAMTINSIVCVLTPIVADKLGSKGVMGCRVVQGLFQGFIFPSVHNILGKWAPTPERSRIGTFVYSGSSFGTIIAMPITGLISASWVGWPVSFYVFGCFGLAWVGLWVFLGSNSPAEHGGISQEEKHYIEGTLGQQEHKVVPTPWKAIFTSWPMWAIIVANFGQNWGYSTLLTEIPNYMNKIMHFDMKSNSLLSAAPYLALWALSFVFGPISDYLINHKVLSRGSVRKIFNAIGTCGPALALVGLSFVPEDQTTLSVALLIVVVGINAAVFCGFQVNHIDLAPNHAGTLMGITNGSSNIFSIIAPLVVQVVVYDEADKALWRVVFIIAAAWYVASAIFYVFYASGEIQYWNDDTEGKKSKEEKV